MRYLLLEPDLLVRRYGQVPVVLELALATDFALQRIGDRVSKRLVKIKRSIGVVGDGSHEVGAPRRVPEVVGVDTRHPEGIHLRHFPPGDEVPLRIHRLMKARGAVPGGKEQERHRLMVVLHDDGVPFEEDSGNALHLGL